METVILPRAHQIESFKGLYVAYLVFWVIEILEDT